MLKIITCLCIYFCLGFSLVGRVMAQDPHFSQFYATPLYLNPAFTGATEQHRFIMNYRNQWPAISQAFVSNAFSYDYDWAEMNSGLGLLILQDRAGTSGLRFTNMGLSYSYHVKLSNKIAARGGINFSYTIKDIDFSRLVFNDQLYRNSGTSFESRAYDKIQYLDVSSGGLLYSENFWIGFSSHHLNKPNESISGGESVIPVKYSVHGGYKAFIASSNGTGKAGSKYITPAFNYRTQGKFDQLDLGFYYTHEPLTLGFWYRGIPLLKAYAPGYMNNDAIIALMGYEIKNPNIKIGYTYDLTLSRLITQSGGSHEISIIYEMAKRQRKKKRIKIPCAKF